MSNSPAIQTEELSKRYKQHVVVDKLCLRVERGEVFGFLGPNGAGKTTTISMLLGLVRPSSGRALLLGHDVQREPAAALRRVGAMIEAPAFYPYLSGRDNLRLLARADGLPDGRTDAALAAVELAERGRERFGTYSQGMKQRLAIAATLLNEPELIILDEPTNGLDPAGQVEIRGLIRNLAQAGRTIFLCSHMLHEVEQLCSRVAILKAGRVLREGRVDALLRRGQGLLLRLASDPIPALALLNGLPWVNHVTQQGDTLLLDAPGERAAEINGLLARHGVLVAELRAHEERLEEFFLEVTN